ncbi:NYN domain-containing protein [Chamaesiphon minutus]|uniref:Putative RNA-binding protein containing a PIN domain n=1 Tax=Chamaesiphon minutus (strain ATCC 27169 / PCC 6605) TaxID=1173020 RepID=K9UK91_CHAP6|nr:NYN domain-containing protein [Chamaesiphon minutus]AFY94619.1 putative RNA-binding protein containing a PIN domain [Chamaesiphon minutus PCC 6605]
MPPSRKQAVLLVDGYNVIGAWTDLHDRHTKHNPLQSGSQADLEAARAKLVEALINYSAFEDYETKVVFDAYSRDAPAYCETITPNLSIHYTDFLETADTYIEKFCAAFRHDLQYSASRLIVATSDRAQQLTAIGFGAEWISSLQLISNVDFSATRSKRRHRPQKQSSGRFLFNSLDPKAQARLSALRHGLPLDDT